jgi:hypothetical protein
MWWEEEEEEVLPRPEMKKERMKSACFTLTLTGAK